MLFRSMHALRFVLEGEGVTTMVEGKPCPMLPGDMIITPGTTWHEHIHEGQGRCVWVDALDVPLHRYLRDPVFEPGPAHDLLGAALLEQWQLPMAELELRHQRAPDLLFCLQCRRLILQHCFLMDRRLLRPLLILEIQIAVFTSLLQILWRLLPQEHKSL